MTHTMDRRGFNRQIALGSIALAVPTTLAVTHWLDGNAGLALHFIYETRLLDPADVPQPLALCASRIHAITGDVTSVWYDTLYHLWPQRQISTAGLTFNAEFFVLKTLASEHGYRIALEQHEGESVRWRLEPGLSGP